MNLYKTIDLRMQHSNIKYKYNKSPSKKKNIDSSTESVDCLTFSAGSGIGLVICNVSPVFSSTSAYIVGHCKQENE